MPVAAVTPALVGCSQSRVLIRRRRAGRENRIGNARQRSSRERPSKSSRGGAHPSRSLTSFACRLSTIRESMGMPRQTAMYGSRGKRGALADGDECSNSSGGTCVVTAEESQHCGPRSFRRGCRRHVEEENLAIPARPQSFSSNWGGRSGKRANRQ